MPEEKATLAIELRMRDKVTKQFKKVGLNIRNFAKRSRNAFKKMTSGLLTMKSAIIGVATGLVAMKVKDAIMSIANLGDWAAKTSQKLGIPVQTLTELAHASDLSGTSVESVAIGFRLLARNMDDVSQGMGMALDAFNDLGVGVTKTDGSLRDTNDVMLDIAEKFSKMPDGAKKTALAMDIFGRSGSEMIPHLNNGKEGLKAMSKEARELGITFNKVQAKQAEEFIDSMHRFKMSLMGIKKAMVMHVIPVLTEGFNIIFELVKDHNAEISSMDEGYKKTGAPAASLIKIIVAGFATAQTVVVGFKTIILGLRVVMATAIKGIARWAGIIVKIKAKLFKDKEADAWADSFISNLESVRKSALKDFSDMAKANEPMLFNLDKWFAKIDKISEEVKKKQAKIIKQTQNKKSRGDPFTPSGDKEAEQKRIDELAQLRKEFLDESYLMSLANADREIALANKEMNEKLRNANMLFKEKQITEDQFYVWSEQAEEQHQIRIDEIRKRWREEDKTAIQGVRDFLKQSMMQMEDHYQNAFNMAGRVSGKFQSELSNYFFELGQDIDNSSQAFENFAKNMFRWIQQIVAELAAKKIVLGITKAVASALGGGGEGGGEAANVSGAAKGGIAKGGIQPFGNGGVVSDPTLGLVGEGKRNEAIVPLPDNRHIPVQFINKSQPGMGAKSVSVAFNIQTNDASGFDNLLMKRKDMIEGMIVSAMQTKSDFRQVIKNVNRLG